MALRGAGPDQQRRADARDQRDRSRHRRPLVEQHDRQRHQREPGETGRGREPRRQRPRLVQAQREQGADQQFPAARHREIESERRLRHHHPRREQQRRDQEDEDRQSRDVPAPAQEEGQEQGEGEVELLLHGERPAVQQRHRLGDRPEIIGGDVPEPEVGEAEHQGGEAGSIAFEGARHHQQRARDRHDHGHQHHRREQPPHPPLVEGGPGETAAFHLRRDDPGDQIAGDDEEDVDPDEAAAEPRHLVMVEQHGEHRDAAQTVEMRPVAPRQMGGRRFVQRGGRDRRVIRATVSPCRRRGKGLERRARGSVP